MMSNRHVRKLFGCSLGTGVLALILTAVLLPPICAAQQLTPQMLEEASRRTGMSKEELLRQYQQQGGEIVKGLMAIYAPRPEIADAMLAHFFADTRMPTILKDKQAAAANAG